MFLQNLAKLKQVSSEYFAPKIPTICTSRHYEENIFTYKLYIIDDLATVQNY